MWTWFLSFRDMPSPLWDKFGVHLYALSVGVCSSLLVPFSVYINQSTGEATTLSIIARVVSIENLIVAFFLYTCTTPTILVTISGALFLKFGLKGGWFGVDYSPECWNNISNAPVWSLENLSFGMFVASVVILLISTCIVRDRIHEERTQSERTQRKDRIEKEQKKTKNTMIPKARYIGAYVMEPIAELSETMVRNEDDLFMDDRPIPPITSNERALLTHFQKNSLVD